MTVTIEDLGPSALALEVHGRLQREDYDQLVPITEERIRQHGKIELLVDVTDFQGWSPAALWEELKFDVKHYGDLTKLAIVGSEGDQEWIATVSKPFTSADVRFFPESEIVAARDWVRTREAGRGATA